MSADLPKLLSPKQAAAVLGLSQTAIYDLCTAGLLEYRRVGVNGGRIRIEEAELVAYLDRTKVESRATIELPQQSTRRPRSDSDKRFGPGYALLRAGGYKG